jgi:hypothetical protein
MVAGKYNLKIEQGATFFRNMALTDDDGTVIDITGYTARMQLRSIVTASSVMLDVSGYMDIAGSSGILTINVPATVTSALDSTSAVYDLEIESPAGVVTRLLQGNVSILPNVTR